MSPVRRLRGWVSAAGVTVVVCLMFFAWSAWTQREWSRTTITISNPDGTAYLARLTDGTSGRGLGTVRLDPGTRTLVIEHVLDQWWRDPSIPEQAAGRVEGIVVEILGDRCAALAVMTARGPGEDFTLDPVDGSLYSAFDGSLPVRQGAAVLAADPCGGRPAPPAAVVHNLRTVPVLLEGRLRVDACSVRTVVPGEAAHVLTAEEAAGAERVAVPSLALQQGRWPLETRNVMLGFEVVDNRAAAIPNPSGIEGCRRAMEAAAVP